MRIEMTKNECIKEIKNNVYGRTAEDLFIKLFNVVSNYQIDGEDNCLDGVLDEYMDEEEACEYMKIAASAGDEESQNWCYENGVDFESDDDYESYGDDQE